MYIVPVLNGLWQGFVISILLFGPAFFKLIHTSIQEGFKKGVILASGVFLSDALVCGFWIFGVAEQMKTVSFQKIYSLVAGVLLIVMGLKYYRHRYRAFLKSYAERVPASKNMLNGFLLNLVNPFTLILWFNVMAAASKHYKDDIHYLSLLAVNVFTILLVLFSMDVLKVFLSQLIGKKLNARMFYFINRYFGLLLAGIGIFFIGRFVSLL